MKRSSRRGGARHIGARARKIQQRFGGVKAESARAKWEKIKATREEDAKRQGKIVAIHLWDNHELMRRLASPVSRGVVAFFFNSRVLTRDVFQSHIEGPLQ